MPNLLRKINKALGLPKKSEVLWDILSIESIKKEVQDNAANIEKYHPNTTTSTTVTAITTSKKTTRYQQSISTYISTRPPVPSTDQAIPSCFYFRIS